MHNLIDKRNENTTYKIEEYQYTDYKYSVTIYSGLHKEVMTVKLDKPPDWMDYLINLMNLAGNNEPVLDCIRIGNVYWIHPKLDPDK